MPKTGIMPRITSERKFCMGSAYSFSKREEIYPGRQVRTPEGVLEGMQIESENSRVCDVFLGVPFAEPPIGKLRFQKPVPPRPWSGVRKCRRFAPRSIQSDMFWDKLLQPTHQSEDCLYLNIFAPSFRPEKLYPVMFYIHGGGFMIDSAAKFDAKNVCKQMVCKDVVVVTIQYRLGFLGFFSLGNEACKGNFGMWDQVAALQWTKKNIHLFGGDPEQITVAGQSAGAVSTDLLSLSPISRDLFKQKIILGGNAICHWAVAEQSEVTEYSRKKAAKLGWRYSKQDFSSAREETEAMLQFLRKLPAAKFGCNLITTREVFEKSLLPLTPVIDGELLPDSLDKLRSQAPPKPTIVGGGQQEALLFVALGLIKLNEKFLDKLEKEISLAVRAKSLDITHAMVKESIRQVYGEVKPYKKAVAKISTTLLSDVIMNYPIHRYYLHASQLPVDTYFYSYEHDSKRMLGFLASVMPFHAGTHCSELIYLFNCNYLFTPWPMNKEDRFMSKITPEYFMSFVKTGQPNSDETRKYAEWLPASRSTGYRCLAFSTKPCMKGDVFDGRMEKLDELAIKFKLVKDLSLTNKDEV